MAARPPFPPVTKPAPSRHRLKAPQVAIQKMGLRTVSPMMKTIILSRQKLPHAVQAAVVEPLAAMVHQTLTAKFIGGHVVWPVTRSRVVQNEVSLTFLHHNF